MGLQFRSGTKTARAGRSAGVAALAALAVTGCLAACQSTTDPATGVPELDLRHRDPKVRIRASLQVVDQERWDLIELLLANLNDRDPAVRLFASAALRKLTGCELDYKPHGTRDERRRALRRLRERFAAGEFDAPGGCGASREAPLVPNGAVAEGK